VIVFSDDDTHYVLSSLLISGLTVESQPANGKPSSYKRPKKRKSLEPAAVSVSVLSFTGESRGLAFLRCQH
jgi:hypothetical protein